MLGHRGSRLGISYPEIYQAQARAIIEAACRASRKQGVKAIPEIMLPLIGTRKEFEVLAGEIREVAAEVFKETGQKVSIYRRHDDRSAARVHRRGPDRRRPRSSSPSAPTT